MSFIGIISDGKNEEYISKVLTNKIDKANIININEKNIDNIKNVRFETILISGDNKKILPKLDILKNIISNVKYLIINADIETNMLVLDNLDINVITFGFNNKSTITASSVKEENVLICVQRTILNIKSKEVEPQEINISTSGKNINIYTIMGIASVLIIYGIDLENN